MEIDEIRFLWGVGDVVYSEEAQERVWQREVSIENIAQAIETGRIVEERRGRPYPKCRVQGWADRRVAGLSVGLGLLNVVCALGEELHIITVFWEKER